MSEENQSILPAPGTYQARRTGAITVRETEQGALCAYIPYQLLGSNVAYCGEHVMTLNGQDGNEMKFNWDNIYNVMAPLGWQPNADDKMNPHDLENVPLTPDGTAEFIAKDCFIEQYKGKDQFKIRFFNGLSGRVVSAEQKAAQEEKWSVKYPSVSAFAKKPAVAAKTEAEKPAPVETPAALAEPAAKKTPGRKPAAAAPAKKQWTREELYAAFLKKHGADTDKGLYKDTDGKMETKETIVINAHWYPACDKVCGTDNQPDTQEQFAAVAEILGL